MRASLAHAGSPRATNRRASAIRPQSRSRGGGAEWQQGFRRRDHRDHRAPRPGSAARSPWRRPSAARRPWWSTTPPTPSEAEETCDLVREAGRRGDRRAGRRRATTRPAARSPRRRTPSAASTRCSTTPATTKFAGHADMDAVDAEDFLRIYRVNVVGPFQMLRAARPLLEATDHAERGRQHQLPSPASRASARPCPMRRPRAR